jgi:hypothetical protein
MISLCSILHALVVYLVSPVLQPSLLPSRSACNFVQSLSSMHVLAPVVSSLLVFIDSLMFVTSGPDQVSAPNTNSSYKPSCNSN